MLGGGKILDSSVAVVGSEVAEGGGDLVNFVRGEGGTEEEDGKAKGVQWNLK